MDEVEVEFDIPRQDSMSQIFFTEKKVKSFIEMRNEQTRKKYRLICQEHRPRDKSILKMKRIRHEKKGLQKNKLSNLEGTIENVLTNCISFTPTEHFILYLEINSLFCTHRNIALALSL